MGYPPQPPPGWPPPYGYGYPAPPRDHPRATTILVLGILSLFLCTPLGPFAWVMGHRALREIDSSGGTIGGRNSVLAGYVCGMVGTALLALTVVILVIYVVIIVVVIATHPTTFGT